MTDIAQNWALRFLGPQYSEKFEADGVAFHAYAGVPAIMDVSVDDDVVRDSAGVTMATGDIGVGVFASELNNLGSESPPNMAEVYVWPTIIGYPSTVFTNADLGAAVYMSDTGTLSDTNGTYAKIGTVFKVQHGYVYVLLSPPGARGAVS